MKLVDLKKLITDNTINNLYSSDYPCFIFTYEDNTFIINQYITFLSHLKNKTISYINSLDGLVKGENSSDSIFETATNPSVSYMYIFNKDTLTLDDLTTITTIKNLIIVCKSLTDELKTALEKIKFNTLVYFPKLEDWQIKEYITNTCPGLEPNQVNWLYNTNQGDIYSLDNQLACIEIMDKEIQDSFLTTLILNDNYSVNDSYLIFKISNAILKRDIFTLESLLIKSSKIELDAFTLIGVLKNNIQNVISIQMNSKATAEMLGISYSQFKAIQYSCNKYSNEELIDLYDIITSIDVDIKTGKLPIDDSQLLNYVILKATTCMIQRN